jgi:hypothetical protein
MNLSRLAYFAIFLVLSLGIVACRSTASSSPTVAAQTVVPSVPAATLPAAESPTPSPTVAPSKVVLLTLPGADPQLAATIEGTLADLAAQDGLTLETRTELTDLDLEPEVRLLAAIPPDPGMLNLAAANPQVTFLAVGIPGVEAAQNLSVIGSGGERPDQQGFLAGYLAAAVTPDWRVGAISRSDSAAGKAARNGFINGVIFFCGLCRPAYPPFVQYPVFYDLSEGASAADQQAAIDTLAKNAVKTVYVFPGAGDNTLLEGLAAAGMHIISGASPPAPLAASWIASLRLDVATAVRQIWPRLLAGEQALSMDVPLAITDTNTALFSVGRQRLVQKLLDDLLTGFVDTGVNPETGDPR